MFTLNENCTFLEVKYSEKITKIKKIEFFHMKFFKKCVIILL